jgi:hypothetical protein
MVFHKLSLFIRIMYLHGPTTESNSLTKVVCSCNVVIERQGIEMCEDIYLVDLDVYVVSQRDVDETVASSNGHLKVRDDD